MGKTNPHDTLNFGRDPIQWILKGQTQFFAARILFEKVQESRADLDQMDGVNMRIAAKKIVEVQFFEPATLLSAFAVELTLKAAILAVNPGIIQPGKRMQPRDWTGDRGNGHTLIRFCQAASVTSDDDDILELLEEYLVWKGRYPVSLEGETVYGRHARLDSYGGSHWVTLVERIERTYFRIRDQANVIIRAAAERPQ